MSLISDLDHAVNALIPQCKVCVALADLPETEAGALRNALSSKLGAKRISVILKQNGLDIGVPIVLEHRNEGHQ